jgi:hypothetical protein
MCNRNDINIDHFLKLSETYAAASRNKIATVSRKVLFDSTRIPAVAAGKDIGFRRLQTAAAWFAENWPENAEWPRDVPRPPHNPEPTP